MSGIFHFSLPKEFEDKDDCKPLISKGKILDYFKEFLDGKVTNDILCEIDNALTKDWLIEIQTNYQKDMYIGCLTDSPNNSDMWERYGGKYTGYCIEYEVDACEVFSKNTFPICYSDEKYDISLAAYSYLLLELNKNKKQYSDEKNLELFRPVYEKIFKCTYIPALIKDRNTWSFEKEWRVMLLKHRTVYCGLDSEGKAINKEMKFEDYIDRKNNIDTNGALKKVYLGKRFKDNPNADKIYEELKRLSIEKEFGIIENEA